MSRIRKSIHVAMVGIFYLALTGLGFGESFIADTISGSDQSGFEATVWDVTASSTDTPKSIPDNNTTGITSAITVGQSAKITAAEVEVHIPHPYIGDLIIKVVCPSGTTATLSNRAGGSADDINQIYALTACNGQSAVGTWKLQVSDRAAQDSGTLTSWTVRAKLESTVNRAPVANAGAEQTVTSRATVTLDGSASSDPDGNPIFFSWVQTAGPAVTLSNANAAKPTFAAPAVSSNTAMAFQLIVNDGLLESPADSVAITVEPQSSITTITKTATDTPKAIPDNNTTGIVSAIAVDSTGKVVGTTVEAHITHTYIGDLIVKFECPNGTSTTLHNKAGGSADNIDQTYTVTVCNGLGVGGSYKLKVADVAAQDSGTLNAWTLRLQVEGDSGIQVSGVKDWYLIGNAHTAGQNTMALTVTAPLSVTSAAAQIDNLAAVSLAPTAQGFAGNLDLSLVGATEHTLSIYTNGAATPAFRRTFKRSHPIYVLLTTDWDTGDSPSSALSLQETLHADHPALKMTHFVGPYTFTDPSVSPARQTALVGWLTNLRNTFGDEIGLHIHPYCNFVNFVGGITCQTSPTYSTSTPDTIGYTVPCSVYNETQFGKMLQSAKSLFAAKGLGTPTGFRAGGWTANADIMRALSANGFVADTSANNWARIEEWQNLGTGYLYNWNQQNWNPINDTTQPYHPASTNPAVADTPGLAILEVPDNGSIVDDVSGDEMISIFNANWNGQALGAPKTFVIGLHPINYDSTYHSRIQQVLTQIDRFLAASNSGPVVYETLSNMGQLW